MGVELRPLGVQCNIACQYCYQHPQRDAGNLSRHYDLDRMKAAVLEEGGPFTLFGGEPLLVPEDDLEALWAWGYEQFGQNSIQTNGVLINEAHIRMFKAYKVHVGISIDGPGDLNDVRWHGTLERTRASTTKAEAAIERLCDEGLAPSLIITLHRHNATAEKLPRMYDWLRKLDRMGIASARLHVLESEYEEIRRQYGLSMAQNIQAMLGFAELEHELHTMKLDIFSEIQQLLRGRDHTVSCVWRACDPYTTDAVQGVEGMGQRSNCGRTNKNGIDFLKADRPGFERYIALYHTPQAYGGCQGCRFFLMCKGQCPGTALDGDWRNRTEHCALWMTLFEKAEAQMIAHGETPLSRAPERARVEAALLQAWRTEENVTIQTVLGVMDEHGAHASE